MERRCSWKRAAAVLAFGLAIGDPTAAANVRVAIAQMHAVDEDVSGNLREVDRLVQSASASGAQIVVFPELVDVGFDSLAPLPGGAQPKAASVPGTTTAALGDIAAKWHVWIATAVLEAVPGGVYDTSVLIDSRGALVAKVRKNFVYPRFRGARAFDGNFQDLVVVSSPWGPIGIMNCADLDSPARRRHLVGLKPSLILLSFANPQANLVGLTNVIAKEAGAPAVGTNMVFPASGSGGESRAVDASGSELWRAGKTAALRVQDLAVTVRQNAAPDVDAGDVETIRLPADQLALRGAVRDDGVAPPTASWSKVRGPGTVTFADASAARTTASFSAAGVYVLELSASDGSLTTRSRVSINVLPVSGDIGLVGHWEFEGDFADTSGAGNHGQATSGAAFSSDSAPSGGTRSLDLRGSDYVAVADASSLDGSGAVTVAAWVKPRTTFDGYAPNGGNDWTALLNKGSSWAQESYSLAFGAYYPAFAKGMQGLLVPTLDESVLQPGVWHHLAAVLDPDARTAKIFVDGVRDHLVRADGVPQPNNDPLHIGVFAPGRTGVDGLVDDVRLYMRALSDAEIEALVPGASANAPPDVSVGALPIPSAGTPTSLSGTVQDDRVPVTSGSASWTRWTAVSAPGAVEFSNRFSPNTQVTFSTPGPHVLALEASDGSHVGATTVAIDVEAPGTGGTVQSGVLSGRQKLVVQGCKKSKTPFQGAWMLVQLSPQSSQWTLDAFGTSSSLQGVATPLSSSGRHWQLSDAGGLSATLNGILSALGTTACGSPVSVTGARFTAQTLVIGKKRTSAKVKLKIFGAQAGGSGDVRLTVKAKGPWQ